MNCDDNVVPETRFSSEAASENAVNRAYMKQSDAARRGTPAVVEEAQDVSVCGHVVLVAAVLPPAMVVPAVVRSTRATSHLRHRSAIRREISSGCSF